MKIVPVNIKIENLTHQDINLAVKLLNESFDEYFIPMTITTENLLLLFHLYDISVDHSLKILDGEKGVGINLMGVRGTHARIGPMGIIKEYQSRGYGSRLLEAGLTKLRKEGIQRVILEVITQNTKAIGLYEKFGFKKTRLLKCYQVSGTALKKIAVEMEPLPEVSEINKSDRLILDQILESDNPWQRDGKTLAKVWEQMEGFVFRPLIKSQAHIFIYEKNILDMKITDPKLNQEDKILKTFLALTRKGVGNLSRLTYNNVPETELFNHYAQKMGFENYIDQWEMELIL